MLMLRRRDDKGRGKGHMYVKVENSQMLNTLMESEDAFNICFIKLNVAFFASPSSVIFCNEADDFCNRVHKITQASFRIDIETSTASSKFDELITKSPLSFPRLHPENPQGTV